MSSPSEVGEEEGTEQFYDRWLLIQEHLMEQLHSFTNTSVQEKVMQPLIAMVLEHHRQFFRARQSAARLNVLAVLTPPWATPFEKSITWIAGWRPRTLLHIAATTLATTLLDDQKHWIERLRSETIEWEDTLSKQMQCVQNVMVSRQMLELARREGQVRNGEQDRISDCVDRVFEWACAGMERVVESADRLRFFTLTSVVKMLSPVQAAEFLAATAMWLLQLRRWGKLQKQRNNHGGNDAQ